MKIKNMIVYITFLLISSIIYITPLLAHEGVKGIVKERMDKFLENSINDSFPSHGARTIIDVELK